MSLAGFHNYPSVRSSLKTIIWLAADSWLKNVENPPHLVLMQQNTHKCSSSSLTCLRVVRQWVKKKKTNLNVAILLDFNAVGPVAALINPAIMYYLCGSSRDGSFCCRFCCYCRRFRHVERWPLSSAGEKLRTTNFPLTSTAFRPVRIFSLCGSGPIIRRTIIDVGINYTTAIRQGWLMSVA